MRSAGDSAIAGNRERMEYHLSALQRRPSASAPPWTVHSLGQPRALSLISCPLSHLAVGLAPFRSARASALWQAVARDLPRLDCGLRSPRSPAPWPCNASSSLLLP